MLINLHSIVIGLPMTMTRISKYSLTNESPKIPGRISFIRVKVIFDCSKQNWILALHLERGQVTLNTASILRQHFQECT